MNAIDCVLTYEELYALFESRGIDLESLEEAPLDEAKAPSAGTSPAAAVWPRRWRRP